MEKSAIIDLLKRVKDDNPIVHHITNSVTINDCANATLAIGGSPVMATSIQEVEDMVRLADALVINFGTLDEQIYNAMILASQVANEKGLPVILDPVGVGAVPYRTGKAKEFLQKVNTSIIRGNATEIYALFGGHIQTRGVDSVDLTICKEELALEVSNKHQAITVISGELDIISNGEELVKIKNGDNWLQKVTGTGCMTNSLIGCFAGLTNDLFSAAIAGMSVMSLAGERAKTRLVEDDGIGTFRVKLMDEISLINAFIWDKGVRFG